jgi:sugar lactone lactonase YvrE
MRTMKMHSRDDCCTTTFASLVAGSLLAIVMVSGRAQEAGGLPQNSGPLPTLSRMDSLPKERMHASAKVEVVHRFRKQMPVGVAVTLEGRMFVSYPRWEDPVQFTLATLRNGREVPFPRGGAFQTGHKNDPTNNLVSLQGLVVDGRDRLWVLDTGTVNMKPVQPFVPKLICFNTRTGATEWELKFDKSVVPPGSYINDLRVDLARGAQGTVYITDSGKQPGIIVVDIEGKRAWRRLTNHESVKPEKAFVGIVEGRALFKNPPKQPPTHLSIGSDGIAISPDGERLYYTPLASRHLYSVSCSALADPNGTEEQVRTTVRDHGGKGVADGLGEDRSGRIYTTNWEHNAILRRRPDGTFETVAHDARLLWPDTVDLAPNGYLYIISNQLHRQPGYNDGKDRRVKPYLLTRINVGAHPVRRVKEPMSTTTAKR